MSHLITLPIGHELRVEFSGRGPLARASMLRARLAETSDPAQQVRLLAHLAAAEAGTGSEAARRTARRAFDLADDLGDELCVAYALVAESIVDLSPDTLDRRLTNARRATDITTRLGDPELAATSYFLLLGALTEDADIRGLDEELGARGPAVASMPELLEGRHAEWFRCMRATLDGRSGEAEQLAASGYAKAEAAGDPDARIVWAAQLSIIRWMQGRVKEVEPILLQARQSNPEQVVWAAAVAWLWVKQGRRNAAAGLLDTLPPVSSLERDRNWLAAIALLAESAAELGPRELVERLRAELLPFADRLVTIGLGVTCWGTAARPLALLARRLGDGDAAVGHYRDAIDTCSRIGAQVWLAECQMELAGLLLERGERDEAVRLIGEADAAAQQLQLGEIARQCARLRGELNATVSAARTGTARALADASATGSARPRVRVLGSFEVTAVDGTVARWRSRKARRLLMLLVARRGAPLPREELLDQLWPGAAPHLLANRLSVALSAVRDALDPERTRPRDHYVSLEPEVVRLHGERVDIDVEAYLTAAHEALGAPADVDGADTFDALEAVAADYPGDAFPDEPYAAWAEPLRREVKVAYGAAAHALGRLAHARGDHRLELETYQRTLTVDPYDEASHRGLVTALTTLGLHGPAGVARERAKASLLELGVELVI